jgi:sugar (pentulose or hexulose) kinase
VLTQVLADVTGATVTTVADEHAATRGAAACALRALGRPLPGPPPATRLSVPDPRRAAAHRRVAPVFDGLLQQLAPTSARLAAVRASAPSSPTPTPTGPRTTPQKESSPA